jgi:hypothetical protein
MTNKFDTAVEFEQKQPWLLSIPAKIISYIFHPLFIPTYIFIFLVYQFPSEFSDITPWKLKLKIFSVFWMTAFFPAFAVFLLWRLKLSESIYLRTQKERIIPYFVTMFFYWWMYYLSKNQTDQPLVLKFFYFGIFWSSIIGVIINNFTKISLHTIGAGSALMALILFAFYYQSNLGLAISCAVLLTGIIATARLLVSNHTVLEIYSGLGLGVICQLAGYLICM